MPKPEQLKLSEELKQEHVRSEAGAKGMVKGAAVPPQQEQGIGAWSSKYQPQPFDGEDDKWRERVRVFRSWSGRFFGGSKAEVCDHMEGHLAESATINDLALAALRCGIGLIHNIGPELHRVLLFLTCGRAQRLVLKASEVLEAYRFLYRRFRNWWLCWLQRSEVTSWMR